MFNAFISVLVVPSSEWSLGREAILVRKAGWHRTYPFNLSFPLFKQPENAVSSARFHQFVTAAVQSLNLPLVLESEDRGLNLAFYHPLVSWT